MSKRYHATTSDEYLFLKAKVQKLLGKPYNRKASLKLDKVARRTVKFIRRMHEIKKMHDDMGWPHPEAQLKPNPKLREALEALKKSPGKEALTNPDGTLYEKDSGIIQSGAGFTISTKGVMNPDGTPFETPIMQGSVMTGGGLGSPHSDDKIKEFLEKRDEGFLREED